MSIQLQVRVSVLEEALRKLTARVDDLSKPNGEDHKATNPNGPRRMCPKCGVKLAYHLHVKHCKGPWQA